MAILQLMAETDKREYTFTCIFTRMLANAWYCVVNQDISLGKKESICDYILKINDIVDAYSARYYYQHPSERISPELVNGYRAEYADITEEEVTKVVFTQSEEFKNTWRTFSLKVA